MPTVKEVTMSVESMHAQLGGRAPGVGIPQPSLCPLPLSLHTLLHPDLWVPLLFDLIF